ncbi:hypothetical protein LIV57_13945 [Chryseobacterium sp. X308]|uniref:hypothetical protein n=1 Tax=Chryseobacterium sp. X308 TaxID=2884873 RepID=UPI001D13462D|nr:hypothetical protein [Chryseobacterium sp. X308]MCC3216369.1 hypothetical protein [Chryseobacterium sp. X308]
MKKNLFVVGLLATFSLAKSQVGINTSTPTATLDVTAKNSTGTGTTVEGLLIPRVDRQKAQSMTGVPVSTLIYVNSIATGTAAGTALNIDTVGYYYYNGTVWTKLHNPTNSTAANLYNTDGTLTANRTVTQGANTLAFTGTQTNSFSVDGTTLSVDAANDRVGLGTATPDTKLTISTPDNSFGLNHTNGTVNLKTYIGGGAASVGTTTANDLRFTTNNTQKMTITPAGDVGIGTITPDTKLTISTPDNSFGLNHTNGTVNLKTYIGGGAASVGTTTANDLRFTTNNTQKMTITPAGDVGIGTVTPDTKLTISTGDNSFGLNHTNGTVNLKTYVGGGAGYLGTTTSNNLNLMANNNAKMTITPAGNVGVGINTPDNSALLDLNAANKGLLLPRVSLSSPSDASTVPSPATGLMVYNNNTAMSPQGTGVYYNGGTPAAPNWGKIGPVSKMYFKYYTFTNPNGDFISNFDTKIPVSSYTAIVVGFDTNNHGSTTAGFKGNGSTNFDFQVPDIYTFQQNGTWRIYADVPNATTTSGSSFVWGVRLLIISNEQMTILSDGGYNLGGTSVGAATASPVP